ncbi:hypothetical protein SLEP1_g2382 [Rubroshorea leprosula]|uniref:Uncharacterized protein n=1 Tax=Rubroshorea leprosula TaxID=152421 RepID=A0AAV5HNJ4_9ROSI|nr:hypothetical protein SLEP1_g2382 [Rubroshorea leprosula]
MVHHHLPEGSLETILGELMGGGTVALVDGVIEIVTRNLIGIQIGQKRKEKEELPLSCLGSSNKKNFKKSKRSIQKGVKMTLILVNY